MWFALHHGTNHFPRYLPPHLLLIRALDESHSYNSPLSDNYLYGEMLIKVPSRVLLAMHILLMQAKNAACHMKPGKQLQICVRNVFPQSKMCCGRGNGKQLEFEISPSYFLHPEKLGRTHKTSSKHKTPVLSVFLRRCRFALLPLRPFLQGGKVEEKRNKSYLEQDV